MTQPHAIVSLLVDPRILDELLDELTNTALARVPWLVFGCDADLMQALSLQWGAGLHLCMILVAKPAILDADLVMTVLEAEGFEPGRCAWIIDPEASSIHPKSEWVFDAGELGPVALACALAGLGRVRRG